MLPALGNEFVIQDDARQHVVWMERLSDPELFRGDVIADYFQSVSPFGIQWVYRLGSWFGVDPILFSKLLPIFLSIPVALGGFHFFYSTIPSGGGAFFFSSILNLNLWMKDDLVSGTPRSFAIPTLLLFLWGITSGRKIVTLGSVVLQSLFYPHLTFLQIGVLAVSAFRWNRKSKSSHLSFVLDRDGLKLTTWALLVSCLALIPYSLGTKVFGPAVTLQEAKGLAAFQSFGRVEYFIPDPWRFYLWGERSGFFPIEWFTSPFPLPHLLGFVLFPLFWLYRDQFKTLKRANRGTCLMVHSLVVAVGLFLAAHLLAFRLFLPSRYSQHPLRIIGAWAATVVVLSVIDRLKELIPSPRLSITLWIMVWGISVPGFIVITGIRMPDYFPRTRFVRGDQVGVYRFLSKQPKNVLIASLSEEINNLPAFSKKRILVGSETDIPYHKGYAREMNERAGNLIEAFFSPDQMKLGVFVKKYGVNFLLLERNGLEPENLQLSPWILQHPESETAIKFLEKGGVPLLRHPKTEWIVYQDERFIIVDAEKIIQ